MALNPTAATALSLDNQELMLHCGHGRSTAKARYLAQE